MARDQTVTSNFLETIGKKQPTTREQLVEICKTAVNPILMMFFHPVYTIVNVVACGALGRQETAGLAIGSLTLGIMAISIGFSFAQTVSTPIA
jgi:hypothetical protein